MKKSNMNKKERSEIKRKNLEQSQTGEGLFLFQNRSSQATLQLPKVSHDGKKWIEPSHTWQGDSFFLKMVPKEAILVKTLVSPDEQRKEKEKVMTEENKLLLDQPDQITQDGKVEHVVSSDDIELNESSKKRKKKKNESTDNKNTLLTEDPIAGVTIIND